MYFIRSLSSFKNTFLSVIFCQFVENNYKKTSLSEISSPQIHKVSYFCCLIPIWTVFCPSQRLIQGLWIFQGGVRCDNSWQVPVIDCCYKRPLSERLLWYRIRYLFSQKYMCSSEQQFIVQPCQGDVYSFVYIIVLI